MYNIPTNMPNTVIGDPFQRGKGLWVNPVPNSNVIHKNKLFTVDPVKCGS